MRSSDHLAAMGAYFQGEGRERKEGGRGGNGAYFKGRKKPVLTSQGDGRKERRDRHNAHLHTVKR